MSLFCLSHNLVYLFYSCPSLNISYIYFLEAFRLTLIGRNPVPTKRICLQSHAAIELILCSYNFIHTLIRFPSYWRFLPMSVSRKASRKWTHYFQQFSNFVPPKKVIILVLTTFAKKGALDPEHLLHDRLLFTITSTYIQQRELKSKHPFVPATLKLLKDIDKSNTTAALWADHKWNLKMTEKHFFLPPQIYSIPWPLTTGNDHT